jgi:hypothetical protein
MQWTSVIAAILLAIAAVIAWVTIPSHGKRTAIDH